MHALVRLAGSKTIVAGDKGVTKTSAIALLALGLVLVIPAWSGSNTGTITLSSGYLSFGAQRVASISPGQTLTIKNNTKYQFAFTSMSAETGFSVAATDMNRQCVDLFIGV